MKRSQLKVIENLFKEITAEDLTAMLTKIAHNYGNLALLNEDCDRKETAEHLFYLRFLRTTFQNINTLNTTNS